MSDVARMHPADRVADHGLVTPNFSVGEFDCRSGWSYPADWIHTRLVPLCVALEAIRDHVAVPLIVRSGYRTESYNATITGASPRSQHVQGRAADIAPGVVRRADREDRLLAIVEFVNKMYPKLGIGGFGLYLRRGFVHVDIRPRPIGDFRLRQWEG